MALDFGTREIGSQPIVGIRVTAKMTELGQIMGPLFGEVMGHIQQNGQRPAGMPFAIYHGMDGGEVDVECGIPVASPVEAGGQSQARGASRRHGLRPSPTLGTTRACGRRGRS